MKQRHRLPRHPNWMARSGCLLAATVAPSASMAHAVDGSVTGLAAGALHPWVGPDHLLAMVLVGLWAVQCGRRARWGLPLLFVTVMTAGSAAAWLGLAPAAVDQLTALSVLTFGALVAVQAQLRTWAASILIGAFAFVHGTAHGLEMPASSAPLAFTAGFAASTLMLHLVGVLIASATLKRDRATLLRAAGASAAVAGAVLLVA